MKLMQLIKGGIFLMSTGLALATVWEGLSYGQASLAAEDIQQIVVDARALQKQGTRLTA